MSSVFDDKISPNLLLHLELSLRRGLSYAICLLYQTGAAYNTNNHFLVGGNSIAEADPIFGTGVCDTETRLGNALNYNYSAAAPPDSGQSISKILD